MLPWFEAVEEEPSSLTAHFFQFQMDEDSKKKNKKKLCILFHGYKYNKKKECFGLSFLIEKTTSCCSLGLTIGAKCGDKRYE